MTTGRRVQLRRARRAPAADGAARGRAARARSAGRSRRSSRRCSRRSSSPSCARSTRRRSAATPCSSARCRRSTSASTSPARPISTDFSRAARADAVDHVLDAARAVHAARRHRRRAAGATHDPLWLLARQWQTGEFQGEDAGTPVLARVRLERSPLARFRRRPGAARRSRTAARSRSRRSSSASRCSASPTRAATCGSPPRRGCTSCACSSASVVGRRRGRRSPPRRASSCPQTPAAEDDDAGPPLPRDDGAAACPTATASTRRSRRRSAGAGDAEAAAAPAVPRRRRAEGDAGGLAFLAWFDARYSIAAGRRRRAVGDADLGLGAARVLVRGRRRRRATASSALTARGVPGRRARLALVRRRPGLQLGARPADPKPEPVVRTVMPAPVRYPGMAADRWWEFEDGAGQPQPHRGRPGRAAAPAARRVRARLRQRLVRDPGRRDARRGLTGRKSLVVTDAFGERTLVPHYTASARPQAEWRLFVARPRSPRRRRAVPAAGARRQPARRAGRGGRCFIRDELSNLVWAVERLAPSLAGGALDRVERYRERRGRDPVAQPPDDATGDAALPPRDDGARLLDPVPAGSASTRPSPTSASGAPRRSIDESGEPALLAAARPHPRARAHRPEPVRGGGAARRRAGRRGRSSTPAGSTAARSSGSPAARAPGAARARAACASTSSRRRDRATAAGDHG